MRKKRSFFLEIVIIIIGLVGVNFLASQFYFRADFTEGKIYTLSQGTEEVLEKIDDVITLKYYFSQGTENIPLRIKNYGKKIEELLGEYYNIRPQIITLETHNAKPDSDEEEWAQRYGLSGVDAGNGYKFYMGLVILSGSKEVAIPFFDPRREQYLEYDITKSIVEATYTKSNTLTIMTDIPVQEETFYSELEKLYKLSVVPTSTHEINENVSTLLVYHPKNISEIGIYAVDQFLLNGGTLVVVVDPNMRTDRNKNPNQPVSSSNLAKLFEKWGVEYTSQQVVGDNGRAIQVNARDAGNVPFSVWQQLDNSAFNPDIVATKEIDNIVIIEGGGIRKKEQSTLSFLPVMSYSPQAGVVSAYLAAFQSPLETNKSIKSDGKIWHQSAIVSGKIESAFQESPKEDGVSYSKKHKQQSENDAQVLLFTDADFINDQFAVNKFNLLGNVIVQPRNDNLNFFYNSVDFISGFQELLQIRSRGKFARPFTRIVELGNEAQRKYTRAEEELQQKLNSVRKKLDALKTQDGSQKVLLTKEQVEQIRQFREQERITKQNIREIRKLLRKDIENLETFLKLINLLVVPIILSMLGVVLYIRRTKKISSTYQK